MLRASPLYEQLHDGSPRFRVHRAYHSIEDARTGGVYRALSGEHRGAEGLNAHGLIIDELHAWHGREFYESLKYSGAARPQPIKFQITTAGSDETGICWERHMYAQGILDGTIIDTRIYPCIYAADPSDDWRSAATWRKCNPSLGVTIPEERFVADAAEAERTPTALSAFKRYRLNLWQHATEPALSAQCWAACARPAAEFDCLIGERCWGGLDYSRSGDISTFVLCFPRADGTTWVLPHFFAPQALLKDPGSPEEYRVWAAAGLIKPAPGSGTDAAWLAERIVEICEPHAAVDFGFDLRFGDEVFRRLAETRGEDFGVAFPATEKAFTAPSEELERLVADGKLVHPDHPILTWQSHGLTFKSGPKGGKIPVRSQRHDRRKTGGMVALLVALGRSMSGANETSSVYGPDRGLVFV
jgi:phage terminase large subunit-like protein